MNKKAIKLSDDNKNKYDTQMFYFKEMLASLYPNMPYNIAKEQYEKEIKLLNCGRITNLHTTYALINAIKICLYRLYTNRKKQYVFTNEVRKNELKVRKRHVRENNGYYAVVAPFFIIKDSLYCRRHTSVYLHRLVAFAKYGYDVFKPGIVVQHLDGNKKNNDFNNISIGSQLENKNGVTFAFTVEEREHYLSHMLCIKKILEER